MSQLKNDQTGFRCSNAQPAPLSEEADRRKHRRFHVARPGKVFQRSTQRYEPAKSIDVSYAGALLMVDTQRGYKAGDILDVGLALSPTAVVPTAALLQGVVVRAGPLQDGRQQVAIRYMQAANTQALLQAA